MNAGSSTSTSTVRYAGPGPTTSIARRTTSRMPRSRTSCANRLVIPCSACQANSRLARPVAAQADLHVAPRVDLAAVDEVADERPVRALDARRPRRRCRCGCRSAPCPTGPCAAAHARTDGSVIEWSPPSTNGSAPGREHLADGRLDRGVRALRVGRDHGRVAEVDHAQLGERVDLRLEVRAGRDARRADRARRHASAGAVGDEVVHRRADDRHVEAGRAPRDPRCRRCRRRSAGPA